MGRINRGVRAAKRRQQKGASRTRAEARATESKYGELDSDDEEPLEEGKTPKEIRKDPVVEANSIAALNAVPSFNELIGKESSKCGRM